MDSKEMRLRAVTLREMAMEMLRAQEAAKAKGHPRAKVRSMGAMVVTLKAAALTMDVAADQVEATEAVAAIK